MLSKNLRIFQVREEHKQRPAGVGGLGWREQACVRSEAEEKPEVRLARGTAQRADSRRDVIHTHSRLC